MGNIKIAEYKTTIADNFSRADEFEKLSKKVYRMERNNKRKNWLNGSRRKR